MRRLVLAAVAVVMLAACSSKDPFGSLPEPRTVVTDPTTTTTEADLTRVPLASVAGGTTTTVALGPGPMTIVGKVEGPGGVVPGAIVELQRVVGSSIASVRVPTAEDGTWNLANVLGGRYRIRAWRVPDLVTLQSKLVFIESGTRREVALKLDSLGGVRVDSAIAPDPPLIRQAANLKVRVAERKVDGEGVVHDTPQAGVVVALSGSGDWVIDSPNPSTTGGDGSTIFRLTCQSDGPQPLFVNLDSGESHPLVLPSCVDPRKTTTTTSSSSSTTTTTR